MWHAKRKTEELYHLPSDPFEVNNLVDDPAYEKVLEQLRRENVDMMLKTHDSALAPEAYMYDVSKGSTPFEALQDTILYPMKGILQMLDHLYHGDVGIDQVLDHLSDEHPLFQYWALIWLQYQASVGEPVLDQLESMLDDDESFVTITAAETLCKFGREQVALPKIVEALTSENPYHLLMAARAFELLGETSQKAFPEVRLIWEKLKEQVRDKWKGYDLYASWALTEVFHDPESN